MTFIRGALASLIIALMVSCTPHYVTPTVHHVVVIHQPPVRRVVPVKKPPLHQRIVQHLRKHR